MQKKCTLNANEGISAFEVHFYFRKNCGICQTFPDIV